MRAPAAPRRRARTWPLLPASRPGRARGRLLARASGGGAGGWGETGYGHVVSGRAGRLEPGARLRNSTFCFPLMSCAHLGAEGLLPRALEAGGRDAPTTPTALTPGLRARRRLSTVRAPVFEAFSSNVTGTAGASLERFWCIFLKRLLWHLLSQIQNDNHTSSIPSTPQLLLACSDLREDPPLKRRNLS